MLPSLTICFVYEITTTANKQIAENAQKISLYKQTCSYELFLHTSSTTTTISATKAHTFWCIKCGKGKARVNIFPQDKKTLRHNFTSGHTKMFFVWNKTWHSCGFINFILIFYVNTCSSFYTMKFLIIIYKKIFIFLFIFFRMVEASIIMYQWNIWIIPFLNFSIGKN